MFIVRLRKAHLESGLSKYRVNKDTGIAPDTISNYVDNESVEVGTLNPALIKLCDYYGVSWRDPEVVEYIGEGKYSLSEDEDNPQGNKKTLLTALAS
ncbi:hypothetical protein C8B47_03630 [filamentous cyanobacterium CCP4]|nr:hypothetical protein C8B47_03630 [filamentous cyanobacterium CCP4]